MWICHQSIVKICEITRLSVKLWQLINQPVADWWLEASKGPWGLEMWMTVLQRSGERSHMAGTCFLNLLITPQHIRWLCTFSFWQKNGIKKETKDQPYHNLMREMLPPDLSNLVHDMINQLPTGSGRLFHQQ